jgi:signal transduction histidine kinase
MIAIPSNAGRHFSLTATRVAVFGTWIAVLCPTIVDFIVTGSVVDSICVTAFVALASLLLLIWIADVHLTQRPSAVQATAVAAQLPAILVAYWAYGDNAVLVFTVLLAMQMSLCFRWRNTLALMIVTNVGVMYILVTHAPLREVAVVSLQYVCFQAIGLLAITFARRAQTARMELATMNSELLATRQLLQESARAGERLRLSRELHDVVGHKLTALKLQLRLQADGGERQSADAISSSLGLADELLRDVRGVVTALRVDDGLDLQQALRALIPDLPHPAIRLRLDPRIRGLDVEVAHTIVRCAQESLTNALRHSHADQIDIALSWAAQGVSLCVEDDGLAVHAPRMGHGLQGIQERVACANGSFDIEVRAPHGLSVRVWLPVGRPDGGNP